MNHVRGIRRWTGQAEGMPEAYRRMSYILFRTDSDGYEILGSRCPDPGCFAVGKSLIAALEADNDVLRYLESSDCDQPPLFIEGKTGVGIMIKHYDRHAGMGMYLQIHESPVILSRLLRHEALGSPEEGDYLVSASISQRGNLQKRDEEGYGVLREAWSAVRSYRKREGLLPLHGENRLLRVDLEQGIESMAGFVGCELDISWIRKAGHAVSPPPWVSCYRPLLLEALLLCLLTEVRSASATEAATCSLGVKGEQNRLFLELSCEVTEKYLTSRDFSRAEEARRHLSLVAELGGLELNAEVRRPNRRDKQLGALPTVALSLEWLTDPTLLPTSDLKSHLRLRYRDEETNRLS